MGKPSIIAKVKALLATPDLELEQCHVLYLMVEIRKVLEKDKYPSSFDVLRFYGNWCAHPSIENGSPFKDIVIPLINDAIRRNIAATDTIQKGSELAKFLSLEFLRENLQGFLIQNDISAAATEGDKWQNFRFMLFQIISEQEFRPKKMGFSVEYLENGNGWIEFTLSGRSNGQINFFQKTLL
jgi:hypothetical protein